MNPAFQLQNGKLLLNKCGGDKLVAFTPSLNDTEEEEPCSCCVNCRGCAGFSGSSVLSASGALMGANCSPFVFDQPFNPCCCGPSVFMDILDAGEYPNAVSFFPNAISGSFDSVAVKDGYVACFFAETNFDGDPFVVAKGPIVINNSNWRSIYPPTPVPGYRMTWSNSNMYSDSRWSRPGSLVICEYNGRTNVPDIGFSE